MVTKTSAYPDVAIPPGEYLLEEIETRGIPKGTCQTHGTATERH